MPTWCCVVCWQEEAEARTQQLAQAYQQYQMARQEVQDTYNEFQREKDELVESIRCG